tara:strand:+ start:613 stop:1023 length:411 start_codon:yes stop_codon:yes gene_type:complete
LNKFQALKGNWIVKKRIKRNILVRGYCVIKSSSKDSCEFREDIKTNIDNKLISGYQIFQIFESKNNINFYLNTGNNKKENVYNFEKNKLYQSLFFCKKDLYLSKIKIISKNFFTIYTKINGPKKNLGILANYYRTI